MTTAITVRHNFETGHRLPILTGKCQNLHGHSWWVEATVTAPGNPLTVVEYGAFKNLLRTWIDTELDHGLMLGHEDPLARILPEFGKVFIFDESHGSWPTVENVAHLLAAVAWEILEQLPRAQDAKLTKIVVRETHVNSATWTP